MERRLAAILAADIVGYSRLVELDEAGTLTAVKTLFAAIIEPKVRQYHGRIVKLMGDGALIEFASAVDAVTCAVEIQCAIAARNADVPRDRQVTYRVGINVGDVVVEGSDIFGDGVIIASRLEALCEPQGIFVSRNVFNQLQGKLDLTFTALGERKVKNVSTPISIYSIELDEKAASLQTEIQKEQPSRTRVYRVALAISAVLAIAGLVWWQVAPPQGTNEISPPLPAEQSSIAADTRPSLAVLPFANMSGEPAQDYFSDGMTEDLVTDLSKVSALTVISSASTASYKGNTPKLVDVAKELNVRYVVQGSIRRDNDKVRITAQLVVAQTGKYLWAERYDRDYADIFDLQDEVVSKIVSALSVQLTPDETRRLAQALTDKPDAYDVYLKGLQQLSFFTKEANLEAQRLFQQAIDIDPSFAAAYANLAQTYSLAVENGWTDTPAEFGDKALAMALKATKLDDELPYAYWSLGRIYSRPFIGDPERAKIAFKRAVYLNPNFADGYMFLAIMYIFTGEAEKAFELIEKAMRINPHYPFWYLQALGMAQFFIGDYQASIKSLSESVERNPNVPWLRTYLIASYGQLGLKDDAEWEIQEVEVLGQQANVAAFMKVTPISDPAYRKIYENALRKAGLPDN
jgi:adenylate cyclase